MIEHDPAQLLDLRQEVFPMLVRRRDDMLWMDPFLLGEEGLDLRDTFDVGREGDVAVLLLGGGDLFGSQVGADVT
jgi:hypothetical protein